MTRSVRAACVLALALSLACLTACGGGGGDEISPPLTRPIEPALHGQCGQAVNQCDAGLFADLADSDTAHQWQCGGSNGGATAACTLPKPPPPPDPIDGACGMATNQCLRGSFTDLTDTDSDYQWSCGGQHGGTPAVCMLPKPPPPPEPAIHGQCGQAVNQCDAGLFADLADSDTAHQWQCGGSNGGATAACALPKPPPESRNCANGAAGAENPALCRRGEFAISGIDKIPLARVQLTNKQMQSNWVLVETNIEHGRLVGYVGCKSYVTDSPECEPGDRMRRTRNADGTITSQVGTTPFTELFDMKVAEGGFRRQDWDWFRPELTRMGVKLVTSTDASPNAVRALFEDGNPPYLVVQIAGNDSSDYSWMHENPPEFNVAVADAIRANKLLFVAGYEKDAGGNYTRHWESSGCKDGELEGGCLWTRYEFPGVGRGTSFSSPHLSAALASVLAVFPDTTPQNLAKFGKSCAKKTGEGIEALLAQSGGVGVADFNCMGDVVSALADLPTGGTADVTINGESVRVSGRDLSLPLTYADTQPTVLAGVAPDGSSFDVVPNGHSGALFTATHANGKVFASVAAGMRHDFFGYVQGHEGVLELRGSAGHKNLFVTFSGQHSIGGDAIRSARGYSAALLSQERLSLTEATSVTVSAGIYRFLGGEADISSGSVQLDGSGWDHRLSVSSETALDASKTVGVGAVVLSPEGRETEFAVGTQFNWRF